MSKRTLINDVGNGKGSKRRIGADDKAYAKGWDAIFNKEKDNIEGYKGPKKENEK